MVLIGIKLPLLVIGFITFFCPSDVNAVVCKTCSGMEPVNVAACKSKECQPEQICGISYLLSSTEPKLKNDVGLIHRHCGDPKDTDLKVKAGSCGQYTRVTTDGKRDFYICFCEFDDCNTASIPPGGADAKYGDDHESDNDGKNSAKSFHKWTPIIFIIWLGLFLIVGAFTGQQ